MTAIQKISKGISDLDVTITNYKRNSKTLDTLASRLALQSFERRRSEMKELLEEASWSTQTVVPRKAKSMAINPNQIELNHFPMAIKKHGGKNIKDFTRKFLAQRAPFAIA